MRLDELPDDIQILLLSYLEPLDILRIRKTCWALCRATLQRTVWVHALRRVCIRNSIFMPTFSVMDMSLLELEYAASGPQRWFGRVSAASSKQESALEPLAPWRTKVLDTGLGEIDEIFLVPGGRYLIAAFFDSLVVWDLGAPSSQTSKLDTPIRFEALNVKPIFGSDLLFVHATPDGKGLLIFVGADQSKLILFRIYPEDEDAQLEKIADADAPLLSTAGSLCRSLSGNRFIFMLGPTLNVWDYCDHAGVSIKVKEEYYEIMVTESVIVVVYQQHVSFWPMPPLSTTQPVFDISTALDILPLCSVPISLEGSIREPPGWGVPSFWYAGTSESQPLIFSISYSNYYILFECIIGDDLTEATFKPLLQRPYSAELSYQAACGKLCNGALVDCSIVGHHRLHTTVTNLPSLRDPHCLGSSTVKCLLHLIEDYVEEYIPFDSCPFSGRFVYFEAHKGITILDLLPMPKDF